MVKLAICVIWDSPFMFSKCVDSLLNLHYPDGFEAHWFRGIGWGPSRRHNDAMEKALAWGADLIVILGADQTYPGDMLEKLTEDYRQTGGMIGALVPFRGYVDWMPELRPFIPVAWRLDPGLAGIREFRGVDLDPDMLKIIDPTHGSLQRAHIVGSGVLLFHRDVLLALRRPWFYETVDRDTMHRVADTDTRFVWRMQVEAGVQLWIDTTIKVGHLHIFDIDDTYQDRFADWADPSTEGIDRSIIRFKEDLPGGKDKVEVAQAR